MSARGNRKPLIAVSPNALAPADRRFYKGKALEYGEASLAASVAAAGALPFMAYRAELEGDALLDHADEVLDVADALVLSGGEDIAPEGYGEVARHENWKGDPRRDAFEFALYRTALRRGMPVLGVCRGAQLITVAEGGSLWQDLPSMREGSLMHRCQEQYDALGHTLDFDSDTFVSGLFDEGERWVNSVHHQGMKAEPASLRVVARAPDGVAEAFERTGAGPWVVGVQWHPEWMPRHPGQRRLFERLVAEAKK